MIWCHLKPSLIWRSAMCPKSVCLLICDWQVRSGRYNRIDTGKWRSPNSFSFFVLPKSAFASCKYANSVERGLLCWTCGVVLRAFHLFFAISSRCRNRRYLRFVHIVYQFICVISTTVWEGFAHVLRNRAVRIFLLMPISVRCWDCTGALNTAMVFRAGLVFVQFVGQFHVPVCEVDGSLWQSSSGKLFVDSKL